jgi:hypothetical protein
MEKRLGSCKLLVPGTTYVMRNGMKAHIKEIAPRAGSVVGGEFQHFRSGYREFLRNGRICTRWGSWLADGRFKAVGESGYDIVSE